MPEQHNIHSDRCSQAARLVTWAKTHIGKWNLICTPVCEIMTAKAMQSIAEKLAAEGFYEIQFVMLTVHRNRGNGKALTQQLLLDHLPHE